jgi:hypothetical protein
LQAITSQHAIVLYLWTWRLLHYIRRYDIPKLLVAKHALGSLKGM